METKKITYPNPDPLASFETKKSDAYGISIARMIGNDWFGGGMISGDCAFLTRRDYVRNKRKFVRGEVDLKEFKDHLSKMDGDLNLLNLDWRYINLGEKFCLIVSNGISDENYRLNIRATDKISISMKQEREKEHIRNMASKELFKKSKDLLNLDLMPKTFIPEDEEEMKMIMGIKDRPKAEIGEQILIDWIKEHSGYDFIENQKNKDLVNVGLISARVFVDKNDGVKVAYVDPENYIHSHVRRNDFEDKYYEGVVDTITLSDIRRESGFDDLTLRKIAGAYGNGTVSDYDTCTMDDIGDIKVDVLRFAFKTSKTIKYKTKLRNGKVVKASLKPDNYEAPNRSDVSDVSNTFDTWLEGNHIVGTDFIYNYHECENMYDDIMNKAISPFVTMSYDIYDNKLRSFTDNIEVIAKRMQITALKIQHLVSEITPDLKEIDLDMLAELDEGKGGVKKETWQTALTLMGVKGVIFTKRVDMGESGMKDRSAVRPMAQQQGSGITVLLNSWAHDYNLIRENTGINPARDGSMPADALVGVNKMAELASNTVTANIVKTAIYFNKKVCEVISSRIHSIYKYKEAKKIQELYNTVLGKHFMDVVGVMKNRHLHEFGFIVEMVPTSQELAEFKEILQQAQKENSLNPEVLSEALDIFKTSPKLAREYLLYKRRQQIKMSNETALMQSREKSKNDAMAAQSKVQAELQAYQAKKQIDLQYEAQLAKIELMKTEGLQQVQLPKEQREFQQDVFLAQIQKQADMNVKRELEDRKDEREKLRATQNSKMIEQRRANSEPIDFKEDQFNLEDVLNN